MRILYHHRTWAHDGQEIHIRAMQRAFVDEGNELREVALAPKGVGAPSPPRTGGVSSSLLRRAVGLPLLFRELAEYAYTPLGSRRLIDADRGFDSDFIYERYAFGNVAGIRAARRLGIPLVLEVNSPLVEELAATRGIVLQSLARRVERFVLSSADLVCAVSGELRDIIVPLGAAPEKTVVIPNGVDLELYPHPADEARRPLLRDSLLRESSIDVTSRPVLAVFVGYPRAWHRLDLAFEAMAAAAADRLHIFIVGTGQIEEDLRTSADNLGIGRRVQWLGYRPQNEIPELLTAFDLALMPGITPYACPLKLIEYMAAGLPTVAPNQANIRELVADGESARLFEPGRSASLAAALRDLTTGDDVRRRLGAAARRIVEQRPLTWRNNALRVIAELMDRQ